MRGSILNFRLLRLFFSILITTAIITPFSIESAHAGAQIDANGQGFLQGTYAEVGIRSNGAFGSRTSIPSGFHETNSPCLGFRVDRSKDGWGSTTDDGDFFCPGTPYEEWTISVGGASYYGNSDSYASNVPGSNSNAVTSGTVHSVTWTSSSNISNIAIQIVNSLDQTGQTLNSDVTLSNVSASTVTDIYFGRGVDPDNNTAPGVYSSTNTVVGQGSSALVKAEWTNGSLLGLRSTDSRARVVRQSASFGTANPKTVWDAGEARSTSGTYLGNLAATPGDNGMYLAVKVPSLAANSSTSFRISYVLSLIESTVPTINASASSNFASNVKSSTATLNGAVNANGISTATSFEYSTSAVLADTQTVSSTTLSSAIETAITGNITGLLPSKTYYFRAKAVNSSGTTYGSIFSFTTFPTINLQPTNDTTTAGLTDSFTVGTTSLVSPQTRAYKWQVATDTTTAVASVAWADVASGTGFTTETFTTGTLTAGMNKYRYRAIVTFTDTSTTYVETSTVVTLTVNPAITITSTTSSITQKYGAARPTRTVTYTGGTDTKTVTATATSLASSRITFDTTTALFTIDTRTVVGTYYDTITITDFKGASTSYTQTITITVADTLTVTSDTPTALTYTGDTAIFTPSVSSVSGLVTGDVISGATFSYSNIGGTSYGPSATKPANAGSYSITPSALTLSSGATSNYVAITYQTSTLTINKAAQATLVVAPLYEVFNGNPTSAALLTTGGSGSGTLSFAYVSSLSTAGACTLSGSGNSIITVTTEGTCRIVATKAASDNYLVAISDTSTVTFHPYYSYLPIARPQAYPTEIVLVGENTMSKGTNQAPVITSGTSSAASPGGTITLIGSGFLTTTSVSVCFTSATFTINSDTSLTINVPSGLSGFSGPILVENAYGTGFSDFLFTGL